MERERKPEAGHAGEGSASVYEAPKVESVLDAGDLEREVMHGIISQT